MSYTSCSCGYRSNICRCLTQGMVPLLSNLFPSCLLSPADPALGHLLGETTCLIRLVGRRWPLRPARALWGQRSAGHHVSRKTDSHGTGDRTGMRINLALNCREIKVCTHVCMYIRTYDGSAGSIAYFTVVFLWPMSYDLWFMTH